MTWVFIGVVVLIGVGVAITWFTVRSDRPRGNEAVGLGIALLATGLATIPTLGIGMIGVAAVGLAILIAGRRARIER